jgi:1,4-alpha-glucan branching enzyme
MTGEPGDASEPGDTGEPEDVTVEFRVPVDHLDATAVHLVGEFNDWSLTDTPMVRSGTHFVVSLRLATGRTYRYKFLIDGRQWENDWHADAYVPNEFGGNDSLLDLTGR